jgi:hypothetical protein
MASLPNSGIAQYPVTAILAPVVIIGAAVQAEIATSPIKHRTFIFIFISKKTNNRSGYH